MITEPAPDELQTARLMAGELASPQKYENVDLFAMRITGTGLAYRAGLKEHVWRNPDQCLNPEFLARCNGLVVVWEHPPKAVLDGDRFAARIVGTVFLPYVKGDEVWAIVKIYDPVAAKMMQEGELSTSPSVVFRDDTVNERLEFDDGRSLLFEGKPSLLDHLAICERGVWDKGGDPAGVRNDSEKEQVMAKRADGTEDETVEPGKGAGDGEKLDKLLDHLGSISSAMKDLTTRMDSMEAKADAAKKDSDDKTEEEDLGVGPLPKNRPSERNDGRSRADAERAALAQAQARADSAFNEHGRRAPKPLVGETPLLYRVRMATELKRFSPTYKGVNLDAIARADADGYAAIENQIYDHSAAEAARPTGPEDGGMIMRQKVNPDTGGIYREFFGRHTFIKEMSPSPQYLAAIHTDKGSTVFAT